MQLHYDDSSFATLWSTNVNSAEEALMRTMRCISSEIEITDRVFVSFPTRSSSGSMILRRRQLSTASSAAAAAAAGRCGAGTSLGADKLVTDVRAADSISTRTVGLARRDATPAQRPATSVPSPAPRRVSRCCCCCCCGAPVYTAVYETRNVGPCPT